MAKSLNTGGSDRQKPVLKKAAAKKKLATAKKKGASVVMSRATAKPQLTAAKGKGAMVGGGTVAAAPQRAVAAESSQSKGGFTAILSAALILGLLALAFSLVVVLPAIRDEPAVIVEVIVPVNRPAPQMQKKSALKHLKKTSLARAPSPLSRMMLAELSPVMAPPGLAGFATQEETPLGFGDDAGLTPMGEKNEETASAGSGPTFFGSTVIANRVAYVIDCSIAAKDAREELVRGLRHSLEDLSPSTQFQVICYSGGAYFPPHKVTQGKGGSVGHIQVSQDVEKPTVNFTDELDENGHSRHLFDGKISELPKAEWLRATPREIERILDQVRAIPPMPGHEWKWGISVAANLEPVPEAIFFVVAGGNGVGLGVEDLLKHSTYRGKPVICTIGYRTARGAHELQEIAEKTGGRYVLVYNSRGQGVPGQEFIYRPDDFLRTLSETDQYQLWQEERAK